MDPISFGVIQGVGGAKSDPLYVDDVFKRTYGMALVYHRRLRMESIYG